MCLKPLCIIRCAGVCCSTHADYTFASVELEQGRSGAYVIITARPDYDMGVLLCFAPTAERS